MTSSAIELPPSSDDLEITLFGRGMGECLLCHLGAKRWLMVDSFNIADGVPIGEAYLDSFEDDEHSIIATVTTHWDDDHTHGMARAIQRHQPSEVWMPVVLRDQEIFRFAVEHDRTMRDRAPSGLRDFVRVLAATKGRGVRRWGIVGRSVETGTSTAVALLFPTDEFVDDAFAALGIQMEPGFGEVTSPDSNATSIVLWVSRDNYCALLGADLE